MRIGENPERSDVLSVVSSGGTLYVCGRKRVKKFCNFTA